MEATTSISTTGSAPAQATPRDFLTVLFRRKWILIVVPTVALAVVTWINLSAQARYSSSTRVLLKRGSRESGLEQRVTVLPREEELASQVEIAKSIAVTVRAQDILNHRPGRHYRIDPSAASAGVVGESNVVDITYESPDPEACPVVADALAQAFMEYHARAFSIPTMGAFFSHQADSVGAVLQQLRSEKEALLARQVNMVEPEESRRNIMQLLLLQQTSLSQTRVHRVGLETQIHSEEGLARRTDVEMPFSPNTTVGGDTWVVELKKTLQSLRVHLEELRGRYAETNPQVLSLRDQIGEVEKQLREEGRLHVLLQKQALEVDRAQEHQLERSVSVLNQQLDGYPVSRVRLEELDAEIQINTDLYKRTREQAQLAMVAGATSPDWAARLLVPAGRAVRTNQLDIIRIALAPLLALAVSIGLAFFVDSLDHSLKSVREVEDVLGLRVLASVREVK